MTFSSVFNSHNVLQYQNDAISYRSKQEVKPHTYIHSSFGIQTQESPLYTTGTLPEAAPDQALRPKLR